jgi:type I restriction enzyme R subunit
VNVLHELKGTLDETAVYENHEVDDFVEKYFKGLEADKYLSPIIDLAADRFNHELQLEESEKADIKIKAKQFVKIYGQMASILPYEVLEWEKLFWFLKFLIPKLIVKTKSDELIDELLESVDLSTYGLERTKLNHSIRLDDEESILDPQNPNPRGAHGADEEKDLLDEIIKTFNERWFHGWDATPEDQRVKFVSLADKIKEHPDYEKKYAENKDVQNRELAFAKIFEEVMAKQRKNELDLYRLIASDSSFKLAMQDTLKRILDK